MDYEDLPKEMKEAYDGLKHQSSTIECEIQDALEDAKNLEEFKESVVDRMRALHDEVEYIANLFAKDKI